MATAAPAKPAVAPDLPARLQQIVTELNQDHLERVDPIYTMVVTTLAAQHAYVYGKPGADKSRMVENWCLRILGANYRRALMHAQAGEDQYFGQYDIAKYDQQGIWERKIANTLGDAHLAVTDEPDKTNGAALAPLLTWMNERKINPGSGWVRASLISCFAAANALLEENAGAMWDRYLVRFPVDYIKDPGNFLTLLQSAVVDPNGAAAAPMTTITLDELHAAIAHVPTIPVPMTVLETLKDLRYQMQAAGIEPSDRRFKAGISLLQASAFYAGRDVVVDDDIEIYKHVLWAIPEHREEVEKLVLSATSQQTRDALQFQQMLDEVANKLNGLAGESFEERADYGPNGNFILDEIETRIDASIKQGEADGRNTTRLKTVRNQLEPVRVRLYMVCMNMSEERAKLAAATA